ncbi:MAG TPA: hypothetical protein VK765_06335 [Solirubrobacteraceae bacterium]|jgi:hypothetical protein|nr:hypothetical protein [Solirubrobacteraceae bacterium]
MGLLDEAIREHLELKRRAGADPSLVAREEQEALAPVLRDDPDGVEVDGEVVGADGDATPEGAIDPRADEHSAPEPEPVLAHEPAYEPARVDQPAAAMPMLSEETQELDMVAAMADDPVAEDDAESPTWSLAERLEAAEGAGEEPVYGSFDWEETPEDGQGLDDQDRVGPGQVPGQERLSFE